jgi:4-hydroxybenzoate polyprenyltransferase
MNVLKFTRHAEWYEPKLIPLLGVGYLVIYLNHYPVQASALRLLFLIFSIGIGAIYVSVINDVCDVKEDVAAGKPNRMQNLTVAQKAFVLATICTLGIVCGYFIYPDILSLVFYSMSWIVFSLYSVYPIRLKERGVLGVFADASGAHLFPTLFIISNLTFTAGDKLNLQWFQGDTVAPVL